jgi:protein-S-isoprenylcysteine O-methyltransferase Ste14
MDNGTRAKRMFWLGFVGIALFVPARTVAWPGAWIFLVLFIGGMFVTVGWLKRYDPELFRERLRSFRQPDQPLWDKRLGLAIAVVWYCWIAFMSFETRAAAVAGSPVMLGTGSALMIGGYLLVGASFAANSFAVTVVRIQSERGQRVVDTGPYTLVRHPIYTASIAIHIGTALLLGARWGLLGPPVLVVLLGIRAVLEERLLRAGLPGYDEYAARVRWRFVPWLW